jgi:hypothetical protein
MLTTSKRDLPMGQFRVTTTTNGNRVLVEWHDTKTPGHYYVYSNWHPVLVIG